MSTVDVALLIVVAVTWTVAWRAGSDWMRTLGVCERPDRWALAFVVPMSGLIASIHLLATVSLLSGFAFVTLGAVTLTFVAITVAARWLIAKQGIRSAPIPIQQAENSTGSRIWLWPVVIVAGVYVVFAIDAALRYPSGYDAMNYHLPQVFKWAREGGLNLVENHSGYCWPSNGSIVAFLFASAGDERMISFAHVSSVLLLAAVAWSLTRRLGGGREAATLALCTTLCLPIVVFQSFSGYVDIFAAAHWLAAVLALIWVSRCGTQRAAFSLLAVSGLFAGIALGSKTTFLPLTVLIAIVLILNEWSKHRTPARVAAGLGVFMAGAMVCSGFWFLRATVETGNPVYPMVLDFDGGGILPTVSIAGEDAWFAEKSFVRKIVRWGGYPWRESKSGQGYPYGLDNGLGAAFAAFVPIGLIVAAWRCRRKTSLSQDQWRRILVVFCVVGVVLLLTVFEDMIRFVLPFVMIAIVVSSAAWQPVLAARGRTAVAVLCIALFATAAAATLKPAHTLLSRLRDKNHSRSWFYQIPPVIDELEPGARIVYLGEEPLTYALLGEELTNEPISRLHWRALTGTETVTADTLETNNVDYVCLREPFPTDWPDGLPLELIFDDSETRALATTPASRVYRVVRHANHLADAASPR